MFDRLLEQFEWRMIMTNHNLNTVRGLTNFIAEKQKEFNNFMLINWHTITNKSDDPDPQL
jgi:hypothetical protein